MPRTKGGACGWRVIWSILSWKSLLESGGCVRVWGENPPGCRCRCDCAAHGGRAGILHARWMHGRLGISRDRQTETHTASQQLASQTGYTTTTAHPFIFSTKKKIIEPAKPSRPFLLMTPLSSSSRRFPFPPPSSPPKAPNISSRSRSRSP